MLLRNRQSDYAGRGEAGGLVSGCAARAVFLTLPDNRSVLHAVSRTPKVLVAFRAPEKIEFPISGGAGVLHCLPNRNRARAPILPLRIKPPKIGVHAAISGECIDHSDD